MLAIGSAGPSNHSYMMEIFRYRRSVLEPGASKPATELVKDFLGREQSLDALKAWMNLEFESKEAKTTAGR